MTVHGGCGEEGGLAAAEEAWGGAGMKAAWATVRAAAERGDESESEMESELESELG
jgi:hypothetical protein